MAVFTGILILVVFIGGLILGLSIGEENIKIALRRKQKSFDSQTLLFELLPLSLRLEVGEVQHR